MTSGRVMVRGAFLSSVGMLASMAGGMGAAVIYTHVLSETQVGVYLLLILACDLAILLNNLGVRVALPKLVAGASAEDRPALVGSALGYQLAISLFLGGMVYLFWFIVRDPSVLSKNESWISVYPFLWLLPPLFLVATQREMTMAVMAGFNRYAGRMGGLVAAAIVQIVLVAVFVWLLRGGVMALALATLASYLVGMVWQYLWLPEGRRLRLDWPAYRKTVVFSLPLYANNALTFGFQRFDTVLVAALLGPVPVAYYEIAKRLPLLWARLLNSALIPFLPGISARVAAGDRLGATRLLGQTAALAGAVSYAGALATLVVQKPLILLCFSEKYLASLSALWLLLAGTSVAVQCGVMGQTLVALDKPAIVTIINVATALLSVGLNLVLIPAFGVRGAGASYLVAMMLSNALQTFFVLRNGLRLHVRDYLGVHAYMGVAMGVGLFMDSAIGWLAALGLFAVLCYATGVVTWAQARKLIGAFRPDGETH